MKIRLDQITQRDLQRLSPSPFVKKYSEQIVEASYGKPILDIACGGARNSILLAYLGGKVVGLDIDLHSAQSGQLHLANTAFENTVQQVGFIQSDLIRDPWPFQANSIGGIVNVHFLHETLLPVFCRSLIPGGYLLIETVEARGQNFRELPQAGVVKRALEHSCSFCTYKEQKTGPAGIDAVKVKLVAVKKSE